MKVIIHPGLGFVTDIDDDIFFLDTERLSADIRKTAEDQIENGTDGYNDLWDIAVEEGELINIAELLGEDVVDWDITQ